MAGDMCESGVVTEARVKFNVSGTVYEGKVKMLSDGTMTAVGDFKPTSMVNQTPPDSRFQDKFDTDRAINHSIAVFFAEKSGSKEILDPVWLDIGVVSVATAYHPKCGKVTFVAYPQLANGSGDDRIVATYCCGLNWMTCSVASPGDARRVIAEAWSEFCKQHEPTIKPAPEWVQVKDCIWVCEHNGWTAVLIPAVGRVFPGTAEGGYFMGRLWKTSSPSLISDVCYPIPLDEAKIAASIAMSK